MDEDDIQLILKQYNSSSVIYEVSSGIYSMKNLSEAVFTMGDHEGTLKIEFDDISMKTRIILTRFGSIVGTLIVLMKIGFDEKSFSNILFCFLPYWDYKPTNAIHADSPVIITREKN